ncbi:homoserine dehydrogenase [Pontibacter sp. 172403-2]|uniref:homoserine dehydrogenase n=1 Tax=Pontibacter rufus TaxID=2791028 RepID=UPI0018AFE0DE|nr:homoserine dehydrogenase [Pontibacter sp. 172403-2]MBF9252601.1 homoserine dehydrogenase [Pontibacter sp. 172403-2]
MSDKRGKRKIGILGFGCVGQGLYDVLQHNQLLDVANICVKDKTKDRPLPATAFTFDAQELLQDQSLDLLAELISDPNEALLLVRQALQEGKTVVSANKKMIAENLPELVELQRQYGGTLLYEAAVCGSIPILRTLEAYYGTEPLQEISGILNGSSNYILHKLDAEGLSYQEALQQAQVLGFAETNPTLDVGGYDALHKICIIAAHAFGVVIPPQEVLRFGISQVSTQDVALAQAAGARIKLVASAKINTQGKLEVQVLPTFVTPDSELYAVNAEFNGVQLQAKFAGTQFLKGRGAGSHPTGSAVWADVSAALAGYKYNYAKLSAAATATVAADALLRVYLRVEHRGELPNLPWQEVTSFGVNSQVVQLLGTIYRSDLLQHRQELEALGAFIAQVPDELTEEKLLRAAAVTELVAA